VCKSVAIVSAVLGVMLSPCIAQEGKEQKPGANTISKEKALWISDMISLRKRVATIDENINTIIRDRQYLESQRTVESLSTAIEMRRMQTGKYPASLKDLVQGGLLPSIPKDSWGNTIHYELICGGKMYVLVSFGKNGKAGGQNSDRDIVIVR
jgi:hypothetical protein